MKAVLPGEDLIEAGLGDLHAGRETIEGLLVAIGAPRLRSLGLKFPNKLPKNPEHRLYDLLAKDDQDSAHSRRRMLTNKSGGKPAFLTLRLASRLIFQP